MASLTIELPEPLIATLHDHAISEAELGNIITQALEDWVDQQCSTTPHTAARSPFTESAIAFTNQILDQNQALFEELARI
jgi:hypothetical protein